MKMGFLKDVFKKDTETLVVDRRKEALRSLIIFCVVLVVALLLLVFIRSLTNVDEIRRANITKDIQIVVGCGKFQSSKRGFKYSSPWYKFARFASNIKYKWRYRGIQIWILFVKSRRFCRYDNGIESYK